MDFKKIISFFLILFILFFVYYFRTDFLVLYNDTIESIFGSPCSKPVTYSIGDFDEDFGITKEEFKNTIKDAENLWENASGINLFEYSDFGEMKINLIYDYRQDTTELIGDLNSDIKGDNAYYLQLKSERDKYINEYNSIKSNLDSLINSYTEKSAAYEREVSQWNKKKGSQEKYNQLINEKAALEQIFLQIQSLQDRANVLVSKINNLGQQLNALAEKLNLSVERYNDVNESMETEFEQGNYTVGPNLREINIYQFANHDRLYRVLAHEMGHALHLEHLGNPEDIMYAYNVGKNNEITEEDLKALNNVCSKNGLVFFWEKIKTAINKYIKIN